uniref:BZIP domain-containing protein n=1 Tax=Panagrolaimus sp. PS1159 TaxID=55785 RepID=A0AC35GY61_9BILA
MFSSQFTRISESSNFTKAINSGFSFFSSKDEERKKIKRQKNNEAVKKCREARRIEERRTAEGLERQRKINENLEKEFERMSAEEQLLKQILPLCSVSKNNYNNIPKPENNCDTQNREKEN